MFREQQLALLHRRRRRRLITLRFSLLKSTKIHQVFTPLLSFPRVIQAKPPAGHSSEVLIEYCDDVAGERRVGFGLTDARSH